MPNTGDEMAAALGHATPPRLCFVVDDEPGIRRVLTVAAAGCGVEAIAFSGAVEALASGRAPDIIFLDLALGGSDAIEMMRALAERKYAGKIQLMSGQYRALLDNVRQVGVRLGLSMLPAITKPFRVSAIKDIFALLEGRPPAAAATPDAELSPASVDLGEALRSASIEFWYQPKMDLFTGAIAGFEALARLDHPTRGILGPAAFIPNADIVSLSALTEHALHTALATSREFADLGFFQPIAINVPASSLMTLPIADIVRDDRAHDMRPAQVILEITEDQVVRDLPAVVEIATRLRLYGITLSVDDFGHAYSSLARLKALPVSELKIDRTFVDHCSSDRENGILCQSIIDLAHRLDCVVVAEGIERDADLRALRQMRCDMGQGYLFGAAMPKPDVVELLRRPMQQQRAPSAGSAA